MRAYTQGISKEQFVREMKWHQKQDAFVAGTYKDEESKEFRGCAVGCGIHSISKIKGDNLSYSEHGLFETYLGIPEWLARVQDIFFEGITDKRRKTWPVEFAEAIPEGVNLEQAKTSFIVKILERNLRSLASCEFDANSNPDVVKAIEGSKKSIEQMIEAQNSGDEKAISAARSAARSAAESAWSAASAAESALWSAAWNVAENTAASAVWRAAWNVVSAAWRAENAARCAENTAASAESALWRAASAESAESAAYEEMADELLEILRSLEALKDLEEGEG